MAAPVSIASTHVHSMRLASGAEALVARVVTTGGVAGYGFSLGTEATPARDMAAWDALGRSRNLPLYALFGKKMRERVDVVDAETGDRTNIDPFGALSIEAALSECRACETLCLVAPHGHPWELAHCAALAGALPGTIAIVAEVPLRSIDVADRPGIGIDWSIEPEFAALRWYP